MKTKLLSLLLLAGSTVFARGVYFGVNVGGVYGPPPPPPVVSTYVAPAPGPGYSWVGGYWYPAGPRYYWHGGYWTRPPYYGAHWVAPNYYGHRYYRGYWRR